MPDENGSLLHGRNSTPLNKRQVDQVVKYFFGFDPTANVRYDETSRTVFRDVDDDGDLNHEIIFGPDIFPGPAIADPNSSLSIRCAIAHELTHKARHDDLTEINEAELAHIDEALTSLGAILRFSDELNPHEMRQLVSDACQRLQKYVLQVRDDE